VPTHIQDIVLSLAVPKYAPRPEPTPIPAANWNDEPLYCLEINDEWISHILGVMTALDQQDTWIGTEDEIYAARQNVAEIMLAFMERCDAMDCCIEPLIRIMPDGSLEVSNDGGSTWTPATTEDPRNAAPQLAPLDGADGDDKRCKAANNIVRQMKDLQTGWSDDLSGGLTLLQLGLAFASGIAALFLTAGTAAVYVVPALLSLAAAVVGTGSEAYDDLFTSDVWDFALCQYYCNCEPDGSFTQSSFNTIMANFDSEFTGTLALAFSGAMQGWQLAGLNRAARIPSTDNLDCSSCDCGGTWCYDGDFTVSSFDTFFQNFDIGGGHYGTYWTSGVGWQTAWGAPNYAALQFAMADIPGIRYFHPIWESTGDLVFHSSGDDVNGSDASPSYGTADGSFDGTETFTYFNFGGRNTPIITAFHAEGVGDNPFGEDNC
jgi:hypothetical protein